uniref:Uncharacterized protein n=1 Tax=Meloidogyne hapla TaxID=6305 RepID=A0A1I8BP15_MELHA
MKIKPLFRPKINFNPILKNNGQNLKELENDAYLGHLTKLEWNLNLERNLESFINICIKFKEEGNYYLIIFAYLNNNKKIRNFVNVEGEKEKCFYKIFKNLSKEDLEILGLFKGIIQIYGKKIDEDIGTEEVLFDNIIRVTGNKTRIVLIEALFDDGSYEFETDKDGNIKEKQIYIFHKNVIKNYLKPRELKKTPKNNFFSEDKQKWFLFDDKYFKMDKYGKYYEEINEEENSNKDMDDNYSLINNFWKKFFKLLPIDENLL